METFDPEALAALAKLSTPALWLLAVGFFSPPVISVIQQSRWSPRTKSLVAFAFYVAVAGIWVYLNGLFSAAGWVVATLIVFIVAGNSYKLLWKPTGVAPAIQAATPAGARQGRHEA